MTRPLNPIEVPELAAFDTSLVDESLSYSYEQRALYHQAALNLALEMESAGRRIRDRHQPTASASLRLHLHWLTSAPHPGRIAHKFSECAREVRLVRKATGLCNIGQSLGQCSA